MNPQLFTLTGPQIANLARYYPAGADIAVRGAFTHVQDPDGSNGCLVGGELDSEPGMAGSIGMSRETFLSMPEQATTMRPLATPHDEAERSESHA